mmetsp:Transcript_24941/g.44066  ORF Transcript_24941/g.44066 Transcript_24941/m.44066 type:complete len:430 (-) Transcript_24941:105-1394(-)
MSVLWTLNVASQHLGQLSCGCACDDGNEKPLDIVIPQIGKPVYTPLGARRNARMPSQEQLPAPRQPLALEPVPEETPQPSKCRTAMKGSWDLEEPCTVRAKYSPTSTSGFKEQWRDASGWANLDTAGSSGSSDNSDTLYRRSITSEAAFRRWTMNGCTPLIKAASLRLSELKETHELRLAGLAEVRRCLGEVTAAEPALVEQMRIFSKEEHLLLGYLRHSDHDAKVAAEKITLAAKFFRDYPTPVDPGQKAEMVKAFEDMYTQAKFRSKDGSAVIYIKTLSIMLELFERFQILEVSAAMWEQFLVKFPCDENTQLCGVTFVEDFSSFSLLDVLRLKKNKANRECQRRAMDLWSRRAFPFSLSRCYILDAPWYFSILWIIFRAFMSKELLDKIVFMTRDDFGRSLIAANPFEISPEEALNFFGISLEASV